MSKKNRVLVICPYPVGRAPSQRFRFEQYLELLELEYDQYSFWTEKEWPRIYDDGDIRYKVLSTMRALLRRLALVFKIRRIDKVFIHREATPVGPPWFEWMVAKVFRKPIIYDFDDAIWLPNSSKANEKLVGKFKNHTKTAKICSWAKTVVVGNEFLAEYARQFCEDVRVIPTTVDTEGYHNPELYGVVSSEYRVGNSGYKVQGPKLNKGLRPFNRVNIKYKESGDSDAGIENKSRLEVSSEKGSLPTIGWTGTHSTLKQLEPLFPTLEEVYKHHPFRFLLISDQAPKELPEFVGFRKWSKETEIEDLMEIDIGLMPLFDTEWERGKCGFKAIQYSALEIPALVSDVGVNSRIVGKQGIVLSSMVTKMKIYKDWQEQLSKLLINPGQRSLIGQSGRFRVNEKFSVQSQMSEYFKLFHPKC